MVTRLIMWVVLSFPVQLAFAQQDTTLKETSNFPHTYNFKIDVSGDKMPEYEGGPDSMYQFIAENIHYPVTALEQGIMGIVYVGFVVDTTGNMVDIQVKRGIGGGCDEEALRVVNLMAATKRWTPGMHEGKPVRVTFTMPITFALEGKKKKRKK
jgi:TonB family protein